MTDTMPIWTDEIAAPWLRPPVTNVHLTLHGRARRARSRFLASSFARDFASELAHGTRRALAVVGLLGVLYLAVATVRGIQFVALTIRSHPVLLDLLAAVVIGAVFLAVSFAVYLRAADKGLER